MLSHLFMLLPLYLRACVNTHVVILTTFAFQAIIHSGWYVFLRTKKIRVGVHIKVWAQRRDTIIIYIKLTT